MTLPDSLWRALGQVTEKKPRIVERKSLRAPGATASTPAEIAAKLYSTDADPDLLVLLAEQLALIELVCLEHFPENIFWDTDLLGCTMYTQALATKKPEEHLLQQSAQVINLLKGFGKYSSISFRYIHDFSYGFDWAKWVKRAPASRKQHGPFSKHFLSYLQQRGLELEELISQDDEKYHRLEQDEVYRNPFVFSREPADETRLLQKLASENHIPAPAWSCNQQPQWEQPYADIRDLYSKQLKIPAK